MNVPRAREKINSFFSRTRAEQHQNQFKKAVRRFIITFPLILFSPQERERKEMPLDCFPKRGPTSPLFLTPR